MTWAEHSRITAIRLLAAVGVLIGVICADSSPEATWVAFLFSLYPTALAVLFPRISDEALVIPIWFFWGLACTLLMMGHPEDFPPPHIEAWGLAFMISLTAFTAASIIVALEIRSSRCGEPYFSGRAFQMTAPAWVPALGFFALLGLTVIVSATLRLFGVDI
jgi:hypothetical protein